MRKPSIAFDARLTCYNPQLLASSVFFGAKKTKPSSALARGKKMALFGAAYGDKVMILAHYLVVNISGSRLRSRL